MRPPLWLLAGGNGAGNTTFYRQFLEPRAVLFANADEMARQIDPASTTYRSLRFAS